MPNSSRNPLQWPRIFRAVRGRVSSADLESPTVDLATSATDPLLLACKAAIQDRRGWSYAHVAKLMLEAGHEVRPNTIRAWLSGRRVPGLDVARALCEICGVDMGPVQPTRRGVRRGGGIGEDTSDRLSRMRIVQALEGADLSQVQGSDSEDTRPISTAHIPKHRPPAPDGQPAAPAEDHTEASPAPEGPPA